MKQPLKQNKMLKELFELETKLTHMFDSDVRVGLAMLDEIRKLKNQK